VGEDDQDMATRRYNLICLEATVFYHIVANGCPIERRRFFGKPKTAPRFSLSCVRRAFLCGVDRDTGRNFEHRRQHRRRRHGGLRACEQEALPTCRSAWVVNRIRLLAETFAIDVVSYAVMSNHLHLVLRVDPDRASAWDSEEVIERWEELYGTPAIIEMAAAPNASRAVLHAARQAIETRRERLCDISCFMKCLAGMVLLQCRHT
jgi:hypothetical protein